MMNKSGKLLYDRTINSISLPDSFADLVTLIKISTPYKVPNQYEIVYIDKDIDEITVTNQEDYNIALSDGNRDFIIKAKPQFQSSPPELPNVLTSVTVPKRPRTPFFQFREALRAKGTVTSGKESGEQWMRLSEEEKQVYVDSYKAARQKYDEYLEKEFSNKTGPTFSFPISDGPIITIPPRVSAEKKEKKNCFKCNGTKVNKKGKQCTLCAGKGKLDPFARSLKKYIEKSLKEEMSQLIENEVKKSIASSLSLSSTSSLSQSLTLSTIEAKQCSLCKKLIEANEKLYRCVICIEFYLCEECEEDHSHQLIRMRTGESYKMEVVSEGDLVKKDGQLSKTWSVKNNGKKKWSKGVKLALIEGKDAKVKISPIEELEPGKEIQITLTAAQSKEEIKQVYQLEANNKKFGPTLILKYEPEIEPEPESNLMASSASKNAKTMKKTKAIEEYLENLRKQMNFDVRYMENMKTLMGMGNWNPIDILGCLINNGNDLQKAILKFIPDE